MYKKIDKALTDEEILKWLGDMNFLNLKILCHGENVH